MGNIEDKLKAFKKMIEDAIVRGGAEEKNKVIKSSKPINLIHEAVKCELIKQGVDPDLISPKVGESAKEIKIAGHVKQKKQDVCVKPRNLKEENKTIDWGPLSCLKAKDEYGYEYSKQIMVINVRSQSSSLAKNFDTLFERTMAEAQNLHVRYPEMVLGEVYLIPVYAYDNEKVKAKTVGFEEKQANLEKYISFFSAINGRTLSKKGGVRGELENTKNAYLYEKCALLIVDFNKDNPKLYKDSAALKEDKLISDSFSIEYADIGFERFAKDMVEIYCERFDKNNIFVNKEKAEE